jgi:hypothetical protein
MCAPARATHSNPLCSRHAAVHLAVKNWYTFYFCTLALPPAVPLKGFAGVIRQNL